MFYRPTPTLHLNLHCKKKSVKFTVKKRQLWLPEFNCKKYGNNSLGFNLNLQLNTVISLTDIMLIYQPIKVMKSVLYLWNTLITTKCRWWWESHMKNQRPPQAAFK